MHSPYYLLRHGLPLVHRALTFTLYRQWGNLLTLAACSRDPTLFKFIDKELLRILFIKTINFFRGIAHSTSALLTDLLMLEGLYTHVLFGPLPDDLDPYIARGYPRPPGAMGQTNVVTASSTPSINSASAMAAGVIGQHHHGVQPSLVTSLPTSHQHPHAVVSMSPIGPGMPVGTSLPPPPHGMPVTPQHHYSDTSSPPIGQLPPPIAPPPHPMGPGVHGLSMAGVTYGIATASPVVQSPREIYGARSEGYTSPHPSNVPHGL